MNNTTAASYDGVYDEYVSTFVQRKPKYAYKPNNGKWRTEKRSLTDTVIRGHLNGKHAIAGVSQWYPRFGALDLDDTTLDEVYRKIEAIGLTNGSNCRVFASESKNSYHVYFRPIFKDNPATVKLYNAMMQTYSQTHKVEIYPRPRKCFRLPFSPLDRAVLEDSNGIISISDPNDMDLEKKLYWFNKLDEFDLESLNEIYPKKAIKNTSKKSLILPLFLTEFQTTYKKGIELLETGLTQRGSRHEAQFQVLYAFWRQNFTAESAATACYDWIKQKHNGYSDDWIKNPEHVKREIIRQATHIWNKYEQQCIYPDAAHDRNYGYLTKADLTDIIRVADGNLPRIKFLGELIRYCNPRQARTEGIAVHRDRLIQWSSKRSYLTFINELEQKGIIVERSKSYTINKQAKTIKLNWQFRPIHEAIKADNRTTNTVESITNSFAPTELRHYLSDTGIKKSTISMQIKTIYDHRGNVININQ